ncbi:uncharacterized protein LOC101235423 [Hydra vulgaris]|uniref:uncharacterized protein LOC101235423 n=1 Tax=Hydra vulgaris TaxID=6087 RepID=UPI0002B4C0CB|nr:uncharacterized protein LOC101235423 [Hydra vulgaris]
MVIVKKESLTGKIGHERFSLGNKAALMPLPPFGVLRRVELCELHPGSSQNKCIKTSSPSSPPSESKNQIRFQSLTDDKQQVLSHLPGLNPDCEYVEKYQMKLFRTIKPIENEYLQLCRQGVRVADLLKHKEYTPKEECPKPIVRIINDDIEIPMIEQIRMKRKGDQNLRLRPDILPVETENKAKLYFAFNRTKGTITRVIATQPRSFRY